MKTLLISIFCLIITCNSFAWTNYVSATGSDTAPYDTWAKAAHSIQDAVDYAVEGNVVLVADGNYTVASHILIVTNNIILKSKNGAGNVSIDGNSTTHCVYLRGNSVIDGFSIINGKFPNGGGIFVQNFGTILNCIFTNNFATTDGGAIRARDALVSNCYFYANGAQNGGAVHMQHGSSVKDCIFESNFSTNGGAVHCYGSNAGGISDCIISNNTASAGGGIYVDSTASTALTNTMIEYNHAFVSGGGIAADSAVLSIAQNCYIKDNLAEKMGGGIYADNTIVSITGTNTYLGIFYFLSGYNNCPGGDGGGMYAIDSDIVLSGEQCYAGYNYSARDGAAFYITNSSLSLLDGAQILAGWTSRNGGGIYAIDSKITMDNSSIIFCGATNGAGIFAISSSGTFNNAKIVNNGADAGYGGGFLAYLTGSYYFTDSIIANNSANLGGGLCAYFSVGDFILNNTDVVSNQAAGSYSFGGGIYWYSLATLEANNSRISYNFSDDNVGGAYLYAPGEFLFNNTEISHNIASNYVGGIFGIGFSRIECVDCDINDNVADANMNGNGSGGAFYINNNGSVDLISLNGTSTVTNNSGLDGGMAYVLSGGKLSAYGDVLIADNRASRYGGGIYATNQSFVSLMPTNGASPRLMNNIAVDSGGGAAIFAASELAAVNPRFEDNISSNNGGAIYLANASTVTIYAVFSGSNTVPPCTFVKNHAQHGGAINASDTCFLNISDSFFANNSAYHAVGKGGAIYAGLSSVVDIENSVIARNVATDKGAGIYIANTSFMQMLFCTVAGNATDGIYGGTLAVTNSIIWNNTGIDITAGKTVDYCDVDGGYATGTGNLDANPVFFNPIAFNYQLVLGSPCIDTGVVLNVNHDCIGNPRPADSGFDLGAYEFIPEPGFLWIAGLLELWIIFKRRNI